MLIRLILRGKSHFHGVILGTDRASLVCLRPQTYSASLAASVRNTAQSLISNKLRPSNECPACLLYSAHGPYLFNRQLTNSFELSL